VVSLKGKTTTKKIVSSQVEMLRGTRTDRNLRGLQVEVVGPTGNSVAKGDRKPEAVTMTS